MAIAIGSASDQSHSGYSLMELVIACGVAAAVLGLAMPALQGFQEASRAMAGARYVAGRLQLARMEALKRSAHVAVGFMQAGTDIELSMYADGNGNGVRSADIANRIDTPLMPPERLDYQVPGARFGIVAGTPSIDNVGPLTGTDPIRVGNSPLVSFSPLGSATPGTVYVCGPDQRQWAVRITGATGRVRVYEFDPSSRKWRTR